MNGNYAPVNLAEQRDYVKNRTDCVVYPYQLADAGGDEYAWRSLLESAAVHYASKAKQLGYASQTALAVERGGQWFRCSPAGSYSHGDASDPPCVRIRVDERLLWLILNRKAHWNNAMVGMHVDFYRDPERYEPDFYKMLSYFHASAKQLV